MGHWLDEDRYRHEIVAVAVPALWVTIVLSLLIHGAVLFLWVAQTKLFAPWSPEQDLTNERLQVRLTQPPAPKPATEPEPPREIVALARPRAQPPKAASLPRPQPAMTAPATAAPAIPAPPPVAPPAPESARANQSIVSDLSAYIEARRRERGERQAPPVDYAQTQPNASIAANLPRPATGAATQDRSRGGGIFEIKRMDYDDAAFEFFGWNSEMGRRTPQLIEVRRGNNSDMRIAVVRRMISIIREYSTEDFVWRSPRRGVDVVLSARLWDNDALESFLMHEFFDDSSHRIQ